MGDHRLAQAQQRRRIGEVLGTRNGRRRAQIGVLRQTLHGQLEPRIGAQRVSVVAVHPVSGGAPPLRQALLFLKKKQQKTLFLGYFPGRAAKPIKYCFALLPGEFRAISNE